MTKKTFIFTFSAFVFFSSQLFAINIISKPIYWDKRFKPTNKFHSMCPSKLNFEISTKSWEKINNIFLDIFYNPNNIQILWINPQINKENRHDMHYDSFSFFQKNPWNKLFTLSFQSTNKSIKTWKIVITSWSYYTLNWKQTFFSKKNIELYFENVPECQPDIIPPIIEIIKPKNNSKEIALDQEFIFNTKDLWKWINNSSFVVKINDDIFSWEDIKRDWNIAKILPKNRLPTNSKIKITAKISDLQSYWWPNRIEKEFVVYTSWFKLSDWLTLWQFKNIMNTLKNPENIQEQDEKILSNSECKFLQSIYINLWNYQKIILKRIANKLNCKIKNTKLRSTQNKNILKKTVKVSVLIVFLIIIILIIFVLKITYLIWFHIYKKKFKKEIKKKNKEK